MEAATTQTSTAPQVPANLTAGANMSARSGPLSDISNRGTTSKGKRTTEASKAPKTKKTVAKKSKPDVLKFSMPGSFHDESQGGFLFGITTHPKTQKPHLVQLAAVPAAHGTPSGYKTVDAAKDTAAARQFHISYLCDTSNGYECVDHHICMLNEVPAEVSFKDHPEIFNYDMMSGCVYEVEPTCPVCEECAECYELDNPISAHIKQSGFDPYRWVVDNKMTGKEDQEHHVMRVCAHGHITMTVAANCGGDYSNSDTDSEDYSE